MKRVREAQLNRHLLDQHIWLLEPVRCQVHFTSHEELMRRLVIVSTEQAAQMSAIDHTLLRNLLK